MRKAVKWICIALCIVWVMATMRWGGDLNWEGRPLGGIIAIAGIAVIWLALIYVDAALQNPDRDMRAMKHLTLFFLLLVIFLIWASWIFRYESHALHDQPAVWLVDRWTGCATLYVARPDGEKKFRSRICPEEDH